MNKDKSIAYQVAFKAAVELTAGGVLEPETDDVAAEIVGFADALFDQLWSRIGDEGKSSTRSGGRSGTSKKRASSSSKSSSSGGGSKFKYASEKQAAFIERLLDQKAHDVEYDEDGFVWNGDEISYDEIPSKYTQEIIEYLREFDNI